MRRNILLVVMAAVILALACPAAQAFTYNGAWEPTSGTVNYISFDLIGNIPIYLYDWGAHNDDMLVLSEKGARDVYFEALPGGDFECWVDSNNNENMITETYPLL